MMTSIIQKLQKMDISTTVIMGIAEQIVFFNVPHSDFECILTNEIQNKRFKLEFLYDLHIENIKGVKEKIHHINNSDDIIRLFLDEDYNLCLTTYVLKDKDNDEDKTFENILRSLDNAYDLLLNF